jgi:hypothetical protein
MREPSLSETPAAFRKIPNRSGGAGRKGVEGEGNSRAALAFAAAEFRQTVRQLNFLKNKRWK